MSLIKLDSYGTSQMMKKVFIAIFTLVLIASTQQFLPKQSDYLPMSDLYAKDMPRSGRDTF